MSNIRQGVISQEEPDECELCGVFAETRPYDLVETQRQFRKLMDGTTQ